MATDETPADPSRQTNLNKCGTAASASEPSDPDSEQDDLPSPDDVLWSVVEELPDLLGLPVANQDGTPVRDDYVDKTWESWESDVLYYCGRCQSTFSPANKSEADHILDAHGDLIRRLGMSPAAAVDAWIRRKSVSGERVSDTEGVPWIVAVEKLLNAHERTRKTTINLRYGWPRDPEFAEHSFSATDRWSPDYQRNFYAECQGWLRELTGGVRPSGGETEASFDNPSVAFITRSASSVPDGDRLCPVDFVNNLRDPWREVYQKLRYTLESYGFEKDEYQYWRVLEPHPGEGQNQAYPHEHIILVVDGELPQSVLRPVMETHVAATPGAGSDAHTNTPCEKHAQGDGDPWDLAEGECEDCDTPVSVRDPESVENLAAYVADYASVDPVDLFQRPPAYIAYAAAMTAGNVRTVTRSDPARWAAMADRCKQMHESPKSDLEGNHGDRLTVSNKGSNRVECADCGSPHGIDQTQTLTSHRLQDDTSDQSVLADGGTTDLWNAWVAAWRAGRPRTAVRECNHPDDSNQCPLCAEYQGAVDATVPIPDDAYVPDDAFENDCVEYTELIEQRLERYPNASPAVLLGMLHGDLPAEHGEALVRGVCAGLVPPDDDDLELDEDWRNTERVPQWHVHSITVDGEEKAASSGNGVTMVEIKTASDSWDSRSSENLIEKEGHPNPRLDDRCDSCDDGRYQYEGQVTNPARSLFVCDCCDAEVRVV